ncbi:ABC-F family ATP-binding cassette domain-containing protein [Prosthecochloris sp. SCSIO W1101]|uniref:ABC-F family ATP-binding cassette domain-containing protein n=1 Tax=Prosthecochloris sp. SCSIO W1101 TaxID=2992242 RepID=UPI00223CAFB2|nr:ABC-F family ATP-binding cassette domain-containing protein [Prosthecochloris sp. SCSIO W1101]UZJ40382.1 ABC-F family ATP-binding cassette domain-containing protein [Prosthecochloris sp. SCSIO W1101]
MVLLTVESISKQYGLKKLFDNVSFGVDEKDKIGIIGTNGSGKSTLLRILAEKELPDSGTVMMGKQSRIAWLPQDSPYNPDDTVLEAILKSGEKELRLVYEYEMVCKALEEEGGQGQKLIDKMTSLSHQLDINNAWDLEAHVKGVLGKLGLYDVSAKMGTLSGGQRKRVALAHALVMPSDALILDEPTNHLDADSVEWLENYLERYQGALVLVTHDRYFLDRVVNRMIELDGVSANVFTGGYASYLQQKEEQEAQAVRVDRKRRALAKQELAWLRTGCKARTTKQKARIQRAESLVGEQGVTEKEKLDIGFGSERLGKKIIELHEVSKSWDDEPLIASFQYLLQKRDRIGIIGPNGSGKTTLLDLIATRVSPDSGRIETGQTVKIGYYDQMSSGLDDSMRVIDYIREEAEHIKLSDGSVLSASKMLEKFLFDPSVQYNLIGNLSGGERRRLYLLRKLMMSPNVLLLDEPTNDLDIPTLQVLEDFLDLWPGCVIAVSHDRYFLDRVTEHIFAFEENGRIRKYPGNYSVYLEMKAARGELKENVAVKMPGKASREKSDSTGPRKLSYKERRELDVLEKKIAEAEERQALISLRLNDAGSDFDQVRQLSDELQSLQNQLEEHMMRWEELAARE